MLPPYELKNKEFSKNMRGYNTAEVDEHFAFIIEKYTELYRENDELERKLKTAYAKLDEIKNEEESIRNAMINAQRASAKLMTEANDRADIIINTARKTCDRILADFRAKIQEERAVLLALNTSIAEFKEKLFKIYGTHIASVEDIPLLEADEIAKYALSDDSYTSAVVQNIKQEIVELTRKSADASPEEVESEEGFVHAESVVRGSSVKDTIKELNKRILDEQEEQLPVEESKSEEENAAELEYSEMLKQLGVVDSVDLEKNDGDSEQSSTSKKNDFNEVYKTPSNYGELIKRKSKKRE